MREVFLINFSARMYEHVGARLPRKLGPIQWAEYLWQFAQHQLVKWEAVRQQQGGVPPSLNQDAWAACHKNGNCNKRRKNEVDGGNEGVVLDLLLCGAWVSSPDAWPRCNGPPNIGDLIPSDEKLPNQIDDAVKVRAEAGAPAYAAAKQC